ncbi:hypothetical protein EVAR_44510_1 [Eumeta japonica]|uniref:Uncharacterized protein n=1 Tax=Eumeta variegata TaxID=151549 RepID=A0A4C1YEA5_EUMVA|nr:hypothetical protein EVAR_44510_1 [Eumeta japonica]
MSQWGTDISYSHRIYIYEAATSVVVFRSVSENSSGSLSSFIISLSSPSPYSTLRQLIHLSVRYSIPFQGTGYALVTPLELRVSMGGSHHLLSDSSYAAQN